MNAKTLREAIQNVNYFIKGEARELGELVFNLVLIVEEQQERIKKLEEKTISLDKFVKSSAPVIGKFRPIGGGG